jgi:alpha-galactosidase
MFNQIDKENTTPAGPAYKKRLTPIMGWASWNNYRINISEELLKKQVDALISTGLAEVGYTYFNIDDGFFAGRDENGYIRSHPNRFPNGMKVLSDYIHSKGLKAGIYSDAGENTCAHIYDNKDGNSDGVGVGLYGHDEKDLRMYLIDWNYDFIKVDWCGGLRMGLDEETRYTEIGRIIENIRQEKNSDIIYNVCRWQFPGEWVTGVADSWRVSSDIGLNFSSLLNQIDSTKPLAKYHGPGHVNDLDMLQIGRGLTYEEDKTHFAMWCMMSTPLMLGNDLTTISEETLSIVMNRELIAVNQDPACIQAISVDMKGDAEIWVKDLGRQCSSQKAIAVLNRGNKSIEVTLTWSDYGFKSSASARDLWTHSDISEAQSHTVVIPAHGTAVYKVTGEPTDLPLKPLPFNPVHHNSPVPETTINKAAARSKIEKGAALLDVRSADEALNNPIEGAMNIPHTHILAEIRNHIEDKNQEIIVCCSTGKRAFQAKNSLNYLGYKNVFVVLM